MKNEYFFDLLEAAMREDKMEMLHVLRRFFLETHPDKKLLRERIEHCMKILEDDIWNETEVIFSRNK
jgi:hypothetical protein